MNECHKQTKTLSWAIAVDLDRWTPLDHGPPGPDLGLLIHTYTHACVVALFDCFCFVFLNFIATFNNTYSEYQH